MTLKEKFIKESIDIKYQVLEPKKFEKIADDYAIEFAEWCLVNNVYKSETFEDDNLFLCGLQKYDDGTDKIYYLYELLEIFKKKNNYETI